MISSARTRPTSLIRVKLFRSISVDVLWQELTFGFPESRYLLQVVIRLVASVLIAGVIGWERELTGKEAGLRTHILVSLGATLFVLGSIGAGLGSDATSRIV